MPITKKTIDNIKKFEDPKMRRIYAYLFRHPRIKKVFFSIETAEKIHKISQKYHFPPKKQRALAGTVGLVLLGKLPLDKLSLKIKQNCQLQDLSLAQEIKQEVYESVIKEVEGYIEQREIKSQSQENNISHYPSQPKEQTKNQEVEKQLSQYDIKIDKEEEKIN